MALCFDPIVSLPSFLRGACLTPASASPVRVKIGDGARVAESIFEAYPSIRSLAKVHGAIALILEHPKEIEAHLEDQDRRYGEIEKRYPLTPGMIERFERAKGEKPVKRA